MTVKQDRARARREAAAAMARSDILDAAEAAFATDGFRAATMAQIARDAGFTAASLYTYFDSKQAIFVALGDRFLEGLSAALLQPDIDRSFEADLLWRVELLLSYIQRERRSMKMFFDLQFGVDLETGNLADRAEAMAPVNTYFYGFFAASDRCNVRAQVATVALMGLVDAFVREWTVTNEGHLADRGPLVVQILLGGILDGTGRDT